jgi:hypothetical protein
MISGVANERWDVGVSDRLAQPEHKASSASSVARERLIDIVVASSLCGAGLWRGRRQRCMSGASGRQPFVRSSNDRRSARTQAAPEHPTASWTTCRTLAGTIGVLPSACVASAPLVARAGRRGGCGGGCGVGMHRGGASDAGLGGPVGNGVAYAIRRRCRHRGRRRPHDHEWLIAQSGWCARADVP